MAGHDVKRTSHAAEDKLEGTRLAWTHKLEPYISSKTQIITSAEANLVYVSTVAGVYALDPATGKEVWFYQTRMPVSHSPAYANGVLYIGCHDNTIHAVDATSGRRKWQTGRAGGGFDVNPLVVSGKVFAGCRDGFFYCFSAADGKYLWSYSTGGPISYSAAYDDGRIFFASLDCRFYCLSADDGRELWKTEKLPGEGFYSWWPVVLGDRVLVAGSSNHRYESRAKLVNLLIKNSGVWGLNPKQGALPNAPDSEGFIEAVAITKHLQERPDMKTLFVLSARDGKEVEVAPLFYVGNPSGCRYPPAIDSDGIVWINAAVSYDSDFPEMGFAGWRPGGTKWRLQRPNIDSADENRAHSLIGKSTLCWLHKNDDGGGLIDLSNGSRTSFPRFGQDYHTGHANFNYGDYPPLSQGLGTHGNQNPPVPLNGRLYFHRSNAVICLAP